MHPTALIIPAAGVGARFSANGGPRKPFATLAGKPVLLRTLERFLGIPDIVQRVVAVHPDDLQWVRDIWGAQLAAAGVDSIVAGGASRQESVRRGLAALRPEIEIVAVHDSVRPFVSQRAIVESIRQAIVYGGAVVACRMVATVKQADPSGRIVQTIPREPLWMARTPQTFQREVLEIAYRAAEHDKVEATDDSFLVERLGHTVMIVDEGPMNIKITTPDDLLIAEAILRILQPAAGEGA